MQECLRVHSRCSSWSKKFAVDNLWRQGRGYDLIYNRCRCPADGCGGFLCKEDVVPAKPKVPCPSLSPSSYKWT